MELSDKKETRLKCYLFVKICLQTEDFSSILVSKIIPEKSSVLLVSFFTYILIGYLRKIEVIFKIPYIMYLF